MSGYLNDFYLEKAVSNNVFSFDERKNRRLYVPSLKEGGFKDLKGGDKIVFEDEDENGEIKSCAGLKNFIRTRWKGIPVYIFDNHNHAFYFWHKTAASGAVPRGLPLVHVDQHKDSRIPQKYLSPADSCNPQKVFIYTNTVLNVGNFIPPAVKTGLISRVVNITSQQEMSAFANHPSAPASAPKFILDLDMDFFAPEMDYIKSTSKITFIKKLLPQSALITVATSPFFINQKLAIKYLRKIFI